MNERNETIVEHLERAWRRDMEKGGTGLMETREVADFYGVTTATARRQLEALYQEGLIDGYQEEPGQPILWRAKRLHYASTNERERSDAMSDARRAAEWMSTFGEKWTYLWIDDGYTVMHVSDVGS